MSSFLFINHLLFFSAYDVIFVYSFAIRCNNVDLVNPGKEAGEGGREDTRERNHNDVSSTKASKTI